MRRKWLFGISLLSLGLSLSVAKAQVLAPPTLLNFQGRLAAPSGNPVPDGTYSIRFSLWTLASGGAEVWNQTLGSVQVKNGTFAVLLDTTSAPADLWHKDNFLEIKVGADAPLMPRQQLVSVAYAQKAALVPDNSIITARLANNAVSTAKVADNAVTSAKLAIDRASLTKVSDNVFSLDTNNNLTARPRSLDWATNSTLLLKADNGPLTLQAKQTTTIQSDFSILLTSLQGITANATSNINFSIDNVSVLRLDDTTKRAVVRGLEITGGSDVAEPFDVRGSDVRAGFVVAIDPQRVGEMRLATRAYDRTVAGVISGAGGVRPGLTLTQEGTVASGRHPVAMTGRVWVWCDADRNGAIAAGDLLTSSNTPGHAMRVSNFRQAQGAVIGKAMSPLKRGKGLVLVLVNLH